MSHKYICLDTENVLSRYLALKAINDLFFILVDIYYKMIKNIWVRIQPILTIWYNDWYHITRTYSIKLIERCHFYISTVCLYHESLHIGTYLYNYKN